MDFTPLRLIDFIQPFFLLKHVNVLLAIIAYAVAHNFVLTLLLVEISGFYISRFGLNPEQTGLNYLALAVGYVYSTVSESPSDKLKGTSLASKLRDRSVTISGIVT